MFSQSPLAEDIELLSEDPAIPWRETAGSTILVTGATGLVGGALIRALSSADKRYGLDLCVWGHGRNAAEGAALRREFGVEFIRGDIREPLPAKMFPPVLDYIFHGAAITRSADMAARPVDVITTAVGGTGNVLRLAVERRCRSIVFLSSMEVYGQTDLPEVREPDLGRLDLSNPRNCYPESKRMCESLCAAYAAQYGLPVKIARLAQTFGAGTPPDDGRVFAQFGRSAIKGENIILHTAGRSRGNYCYTADTVSGLLTLLLKGQNGETYNIANSEASATIREMAELVARDVGGGKIKVVAEAPEDIAKRGYAPDANCRLNADKLRGLGWRPRYGLADMYKRMIGDWRKKEEGRRRA
jgi:nucleoside-diphosphate-sugar epimerase